jgi:hypothetical protein
MNSKRFRPSAWLKWLVPLLLAMLLLGLLTTLIIIGCHYLESNSVINADWR